MQLFIQQLLLLRDFRRLLNKFTGQFTTVPLKNLEHSFKDEDIFGFLSENALNSYNLKLKEY